MLPSKKRLSRRSFDSFVASKDAKTVFNNLGTLKYKKADQNQASVVISSKNEKRAVYRNKLKRRIYNIFKEHFLENGDKNQYVLYTAKKASLFSYGELRVLLNELFKKITK